MKLGVNVDHVATLRQARGGKNPCPVEAALVCQRAGAHAIVMHLREDRRHIQDEDLFRVKKVLAIKLNMEMSAEPSIVKVAMKVLPDQATLVPEKRQEKTTESGLNLLKNTSRIAGAAESLRKKNISVSLFIDPIPAQIKMAGKLGVEAVEFHTGTYAEARTAKEAASQLEQLAEGAAHAVSLGLYVHMGHGLNYLNVKPICRISGVEELNIGHSIVARAVLIGMVQAVRDMKDAMAVSPPLRFGEGAGGRG